MKKIRAVLYTCMPSLHFAGCNTVSYSALQTGSILAPGRGEMSVGTSSFYSSPTDTPFLEVLYRRALDPDTELQAGYFIPGWPYFGLKQRVFTGNVFHAAAGFRGAYSVVDAGTTSVGDSIRMHTVDLYTPLYASFEPSRFFSLYLSPKTILRVQKSNTYSTTFFSACTLGVSMGTDFGFRMELSAYRQALEKSAYQFTAALYF